MSYRAENIDTEKALAHLDKLNTDSFRNEYAEKKEIERYYEGYRKGIEAAECIFYCELYEKKEKKE